MKKGYFAAILLCLPVGVIITAVINRKPGNQKQTAIAWFESMPMAQPSTNLDALKQMGKAAIPALCDELKSEKPGYRIKAAWALGQIGPIASNAVPDLVQALKDDEMLVRTYAIQSLMAIGVQGGDLMPTIMVKLGDPAIPVSDSAVDLLSKIEKEQRAKGSRLPVGEYEYAMAFVNGTSQRTKLLGMNKLKALPQDDERVVAAVNSLLNETNAWVRQQAFFILKGQLPPPGTNFASTSVTNAVTTPP